MLDKLKAFFGFSDDKLLAEYRRRVTLINELEPKIQTLSNDQIREQYQELKKRFQTGTTLDQLLVESFALTREAAKRSLGLRPYDVQLIGGITLFEGKIAEMKTGEGKTLVATLPAALQAVSGETVHLVTVNDYLAKRDAGWMGPVYELLGLKVAALQNNMNPTEKKEAYASSIVYGTNNEFGFDYLRDHMATRKEDQVQGQLNYAIVDEVDSILIDEARTPLIISGIAEDNTAIYRKLLPVADALKNELHFKIEEKSKHIHLTEEGIDETEKMLGISSLYDIKNMEMAHILVQSLRAKYLFKREVDYLVQDSEVKIVDEFTGRILDGRRYGEGLHQAIEAKEKVRIQQESQTLATITFQNFFRIYKKLAGMTGTAKTEEQEFVKIYGLEVIVIPTHQKMIRKDMPDIIYKTKEEKFKAVLADIQNCYARKQPVLVGTISIENSEYLSRLLQKTGIPHQVLNAKYHEKEASIIKDAGQSAAITIATNMAGRGTDIVLGAGVPEQGGLHIIGTERHESRRIDNQLRGRSGRQGDPGSSRFYIALDDDLMRIFGGARMSALMDRFKIPADTPIEHPWINRQMESAQKKVEQYYFGIRKQVLEFDDVMDRQRHSLYRLRQSVLEGGILPASLAQMLSEVIDHIVKPALNEKGQFLEDWIEPIQKTLEESFLLKLSEKNFKPWEKQKILEPIQSQIELRRQNWSDAVFQDLLKYIFLKVLDSKWIEHLHQIDTLREGIGLRAYGQQDPLLAYKMEAFHMFEQLMFEIKNEALSFLLKAELIREEDASLIPSLELKQVQMNNPSQVLESTARLTAASQAQATPRMAQESPPAAQPIHAASKPGRNDPCPCGSGKKYKKCHGANEE